jgi:hypothetical protein
MAIPIPCNVPNCKLYCESVLELHEHRLDNHYQYYFELVDGDEILLLRYMGVLKQ